MRAAETRALGDALLTLLRDAALRHRLTEGRAAPRHSVTQMVSRVEQVYREVCGASSMRSRRGDKGAAISNEPASRPEMLT